MKPYIQPSAKYINLHTESDLLAYSEIPTGGNTDHFDTRKQRTIWEYWKEEEE